jgi:transcriptional/translational regulatory protein YebC/TACO1
MKDLIAVKKSIDSLGYIVNSYELIRIAKVLKEIENPAKVLEFIEKLEDYSDVQGVWCDAKL